jgi:hypothetical protein
MRAARSCHRNHISFSDLRSIGLTAAAVLAAWAASAAAEELPLSRIILSSSGLAHFTHSGSVTGGASIDLSVRLHQVDDILKSLTVLDKEGAVGAVSLPGKAPLDELFRDLPFGPDALESRTAMLNALVGSEVEITGPVSAKGRIFGVETEEVALPSNAGRTSRHRLTLMTEKGLVQALLDEITVLRFSDRQAEAQIGRALSGFTENRAKERRRVSIGFLGQGTRQVAISYVVPAPIWKTAYRLVLPKEGTSARLQGWAILENLTGGDWKDVDLTLVSGNPVTLHQPLYTAFFADRTEVSVVSAARVTPTREDAVSAPKAAAAAVPASRAAMVSRAAPPSPAPNVLAEAAQATAAEEASTQLLFRFPAKVSLATGHTMMVPFADREISMTRAWLYQLGTSARHPLAAVRLRNDGDTGLPAGIVTAFDTAADGSMNFVGDAQLPLIGKGEVKFVTFALDSKTQIRREDRGVVLTALGKGVNGVLTLTTRSRRTLAFEVTAPPDEQREIIIEEPRATGWRPGPEIKDVEETPTLIRYRIMAPKGEITKGTLALERTDSQTVTLTDLPIEDILARISGLQSESAGLRDTVARLGAIVADTNKARAQRSQIESERKKLADDQERIRRNLESVGQQSDLGRRYLDMLKTQEDRFAELARSDQALEREIAAKRQSAQELVRELTL